MNRGSSCRLLQYWKVLVLSDSKGDIKKPFAEQTRPEQNGLALFVFPDGVTPVLRIGCQQCQSFLGLLLKNPPKQSSKFTEVRNHQPTHLSLIIICDAGHQNLQVKPGWVHSEGEHT